MDSDEEDDVDDVDEVWFYSLETLRPGQAVWAWCDDDVAYALLRGPMPVPAAYPSTVRLDVVSPARDADGVCRYMPRFRWVARVQRAWRRQWRRFHSFTNRLAREVHGGPRPFPRPSLARAFQDARRVYLDDARSGNADRKDAQRVD